MDAKQFIEQFGHIANAPGGTQKLREMILQLAISGKLVETSMQSDQVDSEVHFAKSEKLIYEQDKKLRRSKRSISSEIVPFDTPQTWKVVELDDISVYIQRGKGPSYADSGQCKVISQKCIQWDGFDMEPARYIKDESLKNYGDERYLVEGDLLWNSTGTGTAGRINVYPGNPNIKKIVADSHVTVIRLANSNSRYIWCVLASPWIQSRIVPEHTDSLVSGTTQQVELNTSTVKGLKIPLPSSEEQARIVAKVDELMALCDQLEKQQQAKRTLQNQLRQATLQAVATATSPFELKQHWQRLEANFQYLFSYPEDVAELRDLVLELTTSGMLSEAAELHDKQDLEILLNKIQKKKSGKRFAKASKVEEPFGLPNGWNWVLMEDLLRGSESGWSPKCDAEPRQGDSWGVLKVSAVTWGKFNASENKRLPLSLEPRKEAEVNEGDFLLSRANTAELVARSVVLDSSTPKNLMMSDKIVRLNFIDDRLKPWVNLVNNSRCSRDYYYKNATGTSDSMRNVSRQVMHELPVPVPSLRLQEIAIKNHDSLQEICNKLEDRLKQSSRVAENLAKATIATLTGIQSQQEEASMKTPQTELIAPVTLGKNTPDKKANAPLAALVSRAKGEIQAKDLWQRFGGEIDTFYAQLKTEIAHGWLAEPKPATMVEHEPRQEAS